LTVAHHADHFGLVVGIDDYPRFRGLSGAKSDARDFHAWLTDTDTGGGLATANAELVLSRPDPARPIQDDIEEAIERLFIAANGITARRFYLYFSGHGIARKPTTTDLCLATWSLTRSAAALDSTSYLDMVLASGLFREVVFFMDCCRVRHHTSSALPTTLSFASPGTGASKARSFLAYATEYLQSAYEVAEPRDSETGSGSADTDVHGHFTRALLRALRGAAADAPGGVRASELAEYLQVHVPLIAREHGHTQEPIVSTDFSRIDEPRFGSAAPRAATPTSTIVRITIDPRRSGKIVVVDGTLVERASVDAAVGTIDLTVTRPTLLLVRNPPTDDVHHVRVEGPQEVLRVTF